VDGEGDEIYFASGNSITVYSRTAVGTPSQPVRSIQGSATKLYNLQALAVCN
jgi:hypothetical protein